MKIVADFVTSAARAEDLPGGLPRVALVGRSNVGKSSLINALARQSIARTSAAPGKTRLANVYRVQRGTGRPLYLVDLPGYGYARGGSSEFEALAADTVARTDAALLLIDMRHPGLEPDRDAWAWLQQTAARVALVGMKVDKLARAERIRAQKTIESVFEHPALPVSAVRGEGLDELWQLISNLANSSSPSRLPPPPPPAAATARPPAATKKRTR